jgi:DNA polymerase III subunit epsilon
MSFIALDVETANADLSSICQIGLAHFKDRRLERTWKSYINPEDEFDPVNMSIHGITQEIVQNAPRLPDIAEEFNGQISEQIIVCHMHFDRVALSQCFSKYKLRPPDCVWLDTAKVARRTWEEFAQAGYGLKNVCACLGYKFHQHDALEDAKACGQILVAAMEKSGIDICEWLKRVRQPIGSGSKVDCGGIARDGNPEGICHGEVMAFTGSLSIPRREAADMAASIGCSVSDGVTKCTTMLVVGDQDIKKLSGHEKSSKHRKAENLILGGPALRILKESDFMELVKSGDLEHAENA